MHFPPNAQKEESRKNGGKGVDTHKVKPNTVKTEAPKRSQKKNGEDEGCGDRHHRSRKGLFNGAEEALRGNGDPTEEICKAEQANSTGGDLKQHRIFGVDEERGDEAGEEKEKGGGKL